MTRQRRSGILRIGGIDSDEGTPVPIPNTEVKLMSAENTWLETAREDRAMPTHTCFRTSEFSEVLGNSKNGYSSIAQSVEHAAVNRGVVGSSPTGGAMVLPPASGLAAILLSKPMR